MPSERAGLTARRTLGLPSATALVVANMIGFGVFTTSGFALADLGTPTRVLLAWAVAGCIAMLGAISYGALAMRFRESGGEYLFLSRTLHPFLGFLAGWISLFAGFTAPIAGAAAALQTYADLPLPDGIPAAVVGSTAILLAGVLHTLRGAPGTVAQNAVVALKLLLLAGLVVVGLPQVSTPTPSSPPAFSFGAFAVSLVWISLSFSGWNATTYVGGEVKEPARVIPQSMILGTAIVVVAYLMLNAMFVWSAPVEELAGRENIAAVACRAIGGPSLEKAVSVTVAIALFTSISAMVMAGPRVYAKMAEDGVFPRVFRAGGQRPVAALWIQIVGALIFLWVADLRNLISYIGWLLGLSTALTVIGLVHLRLKEGAAAVPVPGWPLVPLAFIGSTLGATGFMLARGVREPLYGLATIVLGGVVYAATLHQRRSRVT